MCCIDGTCARCVRAHLDMVWAGIQMREIKKQLRTEYRPNVAVMLRAKLKEATAVAQGRAVVITVDPELSALADIAR